MRAVSPETRRTLDFDGVPPQIRTSTAAPAACLAADRHLHQVPWAQGTPPFVLRLSPAPCPDSKGLARAGSAVLLSPTIGITAAHIVNGTDGHAHCRYCLTSAARLFATGSQPGSVWCGHGSSAQHAARAEPPRFSCSARLANPLCKPPEFDRPGLFGMQLQPIHRQPLLQTPTQLNHIVAVLKAHHKIVRIANHRHQGHRVWILASSRNRRRYSGESGGHAATISAWSWLREGAGHRLSGLLESFFGAAAPHARTAASSRASTAATASTYGGRSIDPWSPGTRCTMTSGAWRLHPRSAAEGTRS